MSNDGSPSPSSSPTKDTREYARNLVVAGRALPRSTALCWELPASLRRGSSTLSPPTPGTPSSRLQPTASSRKGLRAAKHSSSRPSGSYRNRYCCDSSTCGNNSGSLDSSGLSGGSMATSCLLIWRPTGRGPPCWGRSRQPSRPTGRSWQAAPPRSTYRSRSVATPTSPRPSSL